MGLRKQTAKIEVDLSVEQIERLEAMISRLETAIAGLDAATLKAIDAAKELKRAVDAAEAQRRRPLNRGRGW